MQVSKENEKLDLSAEPLRSLFVGARVERLLAAKQWPEAVAALRSALAACGTGNAGALFFSAATRRKRLCAAVNAVLEHAHTLVHDLPGPHCDSASRHRLAGVATKLLELCSLVADAPAGGAAAAQAADELTPDLQSRCDEMLPRAEHLPHLPAVLQRGHEDGLRRMCIADAALVRATAFLRCVL